MLKKVLVVGLLLFFFVLYVPTSSASNNDVSIRPYNKLGDPSYELNGNLIRGIGINESCLKFTQNKSFLEFDKSIELQSDNFSMAWWMKMPSDWAIKAQNQRSQLFSKGIDGVSGHITLEKNSIWVESNKNNEWITRLSVPSNYTVWHHYSLVFSPNSTKLYIDGELKDKVGPNGDPNPWVLKYIGAKGNKEGWGYGGYFRGKLDEIRVFRKNISQTKINEIIANDLGFSVYKSYLDNIKLKNSEELYLKNGYLLKYRDNSLKLFRGKNYVRSYGLSSYEDNFLTVKNEEEEAVAKLNIDSVSEEEMVFENIWVADLTPDMPILNVDSIEARELRALNTSLIDITVKNIGSEEFNETFNITISTGKQEIKKELNDTLAPNSSKTYSFIFTPKTMGQTELKSVVEGPYYRDTQVREFDINAPINPPIKPFFTSVIESTDGLDIGISLDSEFDEEIWKGEINLSITQKKALGDEVVYSDSLGVGDGKRELRIPYDSFYEEDGEYVVEIDFKNQSQSTTVKVSGPDNVYNPPFNPLPLFFALPVIALIVAFLIRRSQYRF